MRQEYSIVARYGKKGMTYYVRYFQNNRMIPSQWSTRTSDIQQARVFSKNNREFLINKYLQRKEGKTLYFILGSYYSKGSSYLLIDAARGRKLNDNSRKIMHGFVVNVFIPFLQKEGIKDFNEINAVLINRFQNYLLLDKTLLPQSINRQISGIKAVFNHMFMTGIITNNAANGIIPLRSLNNEIRGCYSMDEMAGAFKKPWKDIKSYLLCALIYSTGMRNNEISYLKVKNIISRGSLDWGSIFFISIEKSKTDSGIRRVPLHPKLKEILDIWIMENHLSENDFLFIKNENQRFYRPTKKAGDYLGSLLGKSPEELDAENITFYSGRHFYKTMLNAHNLGDVEELFMGHSVNRKVSELYNHKDKRGEHELFKAAINTIEIIDKCLF